MIEYLLRLFRMTLNPGSQSTGEDMVLAEETGNFDNRSELLSRTADQNRIKDSLSSIICRSLSIGDLESQISNCKSLICEGVSDIIFLIDQRYLISKYLSMN